MKICVYGAASDKIDISYKDKVFEMGKLLGEQGHSMVFGAGAGGLMGAAARGFKAAGAYIMGVIPKFFEENGYEAIFYESDKLVYTDTMEDRKAIMENECDAFVIVPGGIGTMDEFFQIITLKQLGRHKKAIAVYSIDGFYDEMAEMLEDMIKKGFVNEECRKLYKVLHSKEEVLEYLNNYSTDDIEWDYLKQQAEPARK